MFFHRFRVDRAPRSDSRGALFLLQNGQVVPDLLLLICGRQDTYIFMSDEEDKSKTTLVTKLLTSVLGQSWYGIISGLWGIGHSIINNLTNNGIYETLDYESTLELHDRAGTKATFKKRKKIRYMQDDVIAFQDYAWGDGKILLNYRTNRGIPVDRYRSGFKTYILLSLREVKNRGNIDEFYIQWNIRRGFLTKDGYWCTDVSQPTRHLMFKVIFPKARPPLRLSLEETNRRQTHLLGRDAQQKLPDGRWLVSWETNKPRLYEVYVLRWIW